MSFEKLGRVQEAAPLYEDGIRRAPRVEFYVNLGAIWISGKRPDLAIAPLQEAIELEPKCIAAHVDLAGAHSLIGNQAER